MSRLYLLPLLLWDVFLPERPAVIIRRYWAYARTWSEVFSLLFLLRTLLSPWKSIRGEYPDNYMALGKVIQAFTLNMTARGVGLVVRLLAIVLGILVQGLLLLTSLTYLLLWFSYPILLAVGLQFLLVSLLG
jgi:hypothetical protein